MKVDEICGIVCRPPDAEQQNRSDRCRDKYAPEPIVLFQDLVPDFQPAAFENISHQQNADAKDHQDEISAVETACIERTVQEDPGVADCEHRSDDLKCFPCAGCAEEDPRKVDQHKREQSLQQFAAHLLSVQSDSAGDLVPHRLQHLSDHLIESVKPAPHYVGELGSMPETADQEYDHLVDIFPELSSSAAPERDIKIILEPGGQRNMPVSPESAYRGREVRGIEVFHQIDPDYLCGTHGDGRVSRKVAVDLERKQHSSYNQVPAAVGFDIPVHRVDKNGNPVCQHQLKEVTPEHQEKTVFGTLKGKLFGDSQLFQQVF